MPTFTKLSEDEIQNMINRINKRKTSIRKEIRQQNIENLKQFAPGDYVAVELLDGERRTVVKNRLMAAAKDLGWKLKFVRSRGSMIFIIQSD